MEFYAVNIDQKEPMVRYQPGTRTERHNLIMLWGSLFALVLSDGIVTEYLVAQRIAFEWNPLLANWVGNSGFLLIKAIGAILAILVLWDISKRNYRLALAASCCFVALYIVIVFWNVFLSFQGWL